MRKSGHKLDVAMLEEDYNDYRSELKPNAADRKEARRSSDADYFTARVGTAIEVARLGYLFDMPIDKIRELLREVLPDMQVAIEIGGALSPVDMLDHFGAILIAEDPKLERWFAELPREAYEEEDMEVSDALFVLFFALQAGVVKDEKKFKERVVKFAAELTPKRLTVDPKQEKALYDPLAALLQAIAVGDQAAFDKAWQEEATAWKKRYGRSSESANMDGILDLAALGIGLIGQRFGLAVPTGNPYAPDEIVQPRKKA